MFSDRIVVLARDLETASEVRETVAQCYPFHEILTVDVGDSEMRQDSLQSLASGKPDLVLVEVHDFRDLAEVFGPLLRADVALPLILYGRKIENHTYLELHRLGFGNHILHLPATREALERLTAGFRTPPSPPMPPAAESCPMVSFLPGKPGSGASTAAWHFASACSELLEAPVALVDLDLNCGVQSVFGGAVSGMNLFDVISVVDHTGRLPEPQYLPSRGRVVLLSTQRRCRSSRIDARLFENFLAAVRTACRLVVIDHSGNWERFSVQAMKASEIIFCVSSNDYLSLAQTHRAVALIEEEGFVGAVRLILNRHGSRYGASIEEAERLSGFQTAAILPNSFGHLQAALRRTRLADAGTPYASAVSELATRTLKSLRILGDDNSAQIHRWEESRKWLAALGLSRRRAPAASAHLIGRP